MKTESTLIGLPLARQLKAADAPAIGDDLNELTNAQFAEAVARASIVLAEQGVRGEDVVALLLPNSVEFVVALFACWQLGAIVTPVSPFLTRVEVAFQLADAHTRLVVTTDDLSVKCATDVAILTDLLGREAPNGATTILRGGPAGDRSVDPEAPALVIYTSGTTGQPKGVVLTHTNSLAMASMIGEALEFDSTTASLLILPLFHVNGIMVGTLAPLLAGGRVHIAKKFNAAEFFDTVAHVRPSYFSAVPTIYAKMLAEPAPSSGAFDSLRFVICGAAPAPIELLRSAEDLLGVPVIEGYGLSEGSCASTLNPLRGDRRPGTVGRPLPGQSVLIVDDDGVEVPRGGLGEVVITGPNVMAGYLGHPDETARTLVDGRLRTGDIGRLDEAGYLVLVDRLKDMIIRGGENIYPKEIENAVHTIDGVTGAAVVGRPDSIFGEVPVLFLSIARDAVLDELKVIQALTPLVSKIKLPTEIYFVDEIPTNSVGKFDKPALRGRLADMVI